MKQFATCNDIVKSIRANDTVMDPGDYVIGWMDGPNAVAFFYGKLIRVLTTRSIDGFSIKYEIESANTGALVTCEHACLFDGDTDDEQT